MVKFGRGAKPVGSGAVAAMTYTGARVTQKKREDERREENQRKRLIG